MKIKKTLAMAVLCLLSINCLPQNLNKFIGVSLSYNHDNLTNNRLLSNYFPVDKNNSNIMEIFGEFGINSSSKRAIGFDLGYHLNQSVKEVLGSATQAPDYFKSSITGFVFGPKYRIMRSISDKINFYTDFKIQIHYLRHRNTMTQLDPVTIQSQTRHMNGNEFKYGAAIVPGLAFYPASRIGIKIDYTLIEFFYSTINESNNNDIKFKPINSWDYGLMTKLSELKLGLIFKI